jgi:ADP-ribose pyrophosphatase YjhB (NUDIX family)
VIFKPIAYIKYVHFWIYHLHPAIVGVMKENYTPRWLEWAREIQALSQTGLTFSQTDFDTQRYIRLSEIAAEIVHSQSNLDKESTFQNFLKQPGYATPKVDVRGAAIRNEKILLVQERTDGCWCLPGGWADVGESPSEVVMREVVEESGFKVVPSKVIGVFDANRSGKPLEFYHAYKIIFLCNICGGQPRPSNETQAVGFFKLDDLPPLSENRTNMKHLSEIFRHYNDKNRPVAFD